MANTFSFFILSLFIYFFFLFCFIWLGFFRLNESLALKIRICISWIINWTQENSFCFIIFITFLFIYLFVCLLYLIATNYHFFCSFTIYEDRYRKKKKKKLLETRYLIRKLVFSSSRDHCFLFICNISILYKY